MVRRAGMEMTVTEEDVYTHRSLETGGMCAMQGHMEVALRNRVKLKSLWEGGRLRSYRRVGYPSVPKGEGE